MKKLLLLGTIVAIAMMFTSCGEKKAESKKIGEYDLVEQGGKLGVNYGGYVVLAPEYDEISEQYSSLFAKKSDGTTTIIARKSEVLTAKIDNISPTIDPEYFVISTSGKVYLWKKGTGYLRGTFNNVVLLASENNGIFVFCCDDNGWGVMNYSTSLAPRKYDKVYIAEGNKTYAILVYSKAGGWTMYDKDGVSDGVRYDTPSKTLEQQLKKFDTSEPHGVLKVDWPL